MAGAAEARMSEALEREAALLRAELCQLFFEANDEDIKKREPKRSKLRLSALLVLAMLG